jgi:hypothetical protein
LPDNKLPVNWQSFLRLNENKTELFQVLSKEAVTINPEIGQVESTYDEEALCNIHEYDINIISQSNHEEADTRLIYMQGIMQTKTSLKY